MKYHKSQHLTLLKRFLELKKSNKSIFNEVNEERENFVKLMGYESVVFDHIFWTKRKDFMLLIQNFIADSINYEKINSAVVWLQSAVPLKKSSMKFLLSKK
jgi:hypothetical protein